MKLGFGQHDLQLIFLVIDAGQRRIGFGQVAQIDEHLGHAAGDLGPDHRHLVGHQAALAFDDRRPGARLDAVHGRLDDRQLGRIRRRGRRRLIVAATGEGDKKGRRTKSGGKTSEHQDTPGTACNESTELRYHPRPSSGPNCL
jgi:hypothetical protein